MIIDNANLRFILILKEKIARFWYIVHFANFEINVSL